MAVEIDIFIRYLTNHTIAYYKIDFLWTSYYSIKQFILVDMDLYMETHWY